MSLESARELHFAGKLQDAERIYRGILASDPRNVDALHLLGILLNQTGQFAAAVDSIQQAVHCRPSDAYLLNDLGNALKDARRPLEAEKHYREALKQFPRYADAHSNLAILLQSGGKLEEAEGHARAALAIEPNHPAAWNHLGMILSDKKKYEEAVAAFRRALEIQPRFPEAYTNLGVALSALGSLKEAMECHRKALAIYPALARAYTNVGHLCMKLMRPLDALAAYRRALELSPNAVDRHNDIAEAMSLAGDREGSVESYRKSLAREPTAAAYHGLAQGLTWIGGLEEAEINFRRALELNPQAWWTHSALLVLLNHIPGRSAAEIYAEHVKFGRRYDPRLGKRQWQNKRDSARRLRVGYVSGELREHSVVYFFEPLLAKHNRREFEVTCYHSSPWSDDTTERMKSLADRWRDVDRLDDDALANQIRDDRIDILVDLSGHSGHARLPAFARKPAPVQVTWLGYLNTTGLEQMDWRVTDRYAAPDGMLDRYHTEKLLRLEHGQWCYLPPQSAPAVAQSPFLKAGHCTFGAFATPSKMNPVVIALWRRLLDLVPGTRLRVVTNAVNKIPAAFRQKVLDGGIDPRRLDLLPRCSFDEYLALHESVDVMLDTFPYTGGTTTCHCLWMGVPLVTLTGDTSTSRGGASLLHAVGLEEFVARSPEKYVQIAANLARDPERLVSLRSTLRERMSGSRLMDAAGFTQEFEQAYRFMWQEWCKRAD